MEKETWKKISDFPNYFISNQSRVKSIKTKRERILRPGISSGYKVVSLYRDRKRYTKPIGQLVATTFLGEKPEGHVLSYLDGNTINNKSANLKWETRQENAKRRKPHKRRLKSGSTVRREIYKIKTLIKRGCSIPQIAEHMGLDQRYIMSIKRRANGITCLSREEINIIKVLLISGMSKEIISRRHNVSFSAITMIEKLPIHKKEVFKIDPAFIESEEGFDPNRIFKDTGLSVKQILRIEKLQRAKWRSTYVISRGLRIPEEKIIEIIENKTWEKVYEIK